MPNKTLYVQARDARTWEIAARTARRRRMSLSALVAVALEQYLRGTADATDR